MAEPAARDADGRATHGRSQEREAAGNIADRAHPRRSAHRADREWYLNLVANPDIDLTIDGDTRPMRARTASETEKDEMWPAIVAANKGYAGYQKKTTRPIPVVICEPRS